jgi:hypothetical protein
MSRATMTRSEANALVREAFGGGVRPGWQRTRCPLCATRIGSKDWRGGLGLNGSDGKWHCFRCGAFGGLPELRDEDADARTADDALVPAEPVEVAENWYSLAGDEASASVLFDPAWDFLAQRGVWYELVEQAHIGVCLRGNCAGRVVIPVLNELGDVRQEAWLGWVGRSWQRRGHPMPYRYPKGMKRRGLLWNSAALDVETDVPLLVGEGVFDVLKFWPDGVALFGKPDDLQLDRLVEAPRPVVVCLDGDAHTAGWMMALKLRHLGHPRVGALRLPPGTDPDEIDPFVLRDAAVESLDHFDPVPL